MIDAHFRCSFTSADYLVVMNNLLELNQMK